MNDKTRLLQAYLDGELAPEERQEVQDRLDADPAWRQELAELQQVWAAVDTLDAPAAGAELWHGVEAGLRARRRQQLTPWTVTQKLAAAAAVVAGVVLGFNVGHQPSGSEAALDMAVTSTAAISDYQDELPTLDAMWLQLGSVEEDNES